MKIKPKHTAELLEVTNLFLKEKGLDRIHHALKVTKDAYLLVNPDNVKEKEEISEIFTLIEEHLVFLEMLAVDGPQVK